MSIFAQRLKELRESKAVSQKYIGELCKLPQQVISKWEQATRQPSIENIILLCKYFECTADYLLGLTDY